MHLKNLTIGRNVYNFDYDGVKPGAVYGTVTFENDGKHEVKIVLTKRHIDQILAIVADSMVETTRALANDLTASIIEHSSSIGLIGNDVSVSELENAP